VESRAAEDDARDARASLTRESSPSLSLSPFSLALAFTVGPSHSAAGWPAHRELLRPSFRHSRRRRPHSHARSRARTRRSAVVADRGAEGRPRGPISSNARCLSAASQKSLYPAELCSRGGRGRCGGTRSTCTASAGLWRCRGKSRESVRAPRDPNSSLLFRWDAPAEGAHLDPQIWGILVVASPLEAHIALDNLIEITPLPNTRMISMRSDRVKGFARRV
jgi:hypothetical protein